VGLKSATGGRGNQLVNIKVLIPENLTEEQKKHFQFLKDTGILIP
jgi:DnaJ-class molecular chaperone with C-terminal Zn finger domain